MKKSLLLVASLISLPIVAHADDVSGSRNWAGAYAGITVGSASGSSDFGPTGLAVAGDPYENGTIDLSGGAYGVQFGYNFEAGNNIVVGLVADYSSLSVDGDQCVEHNTGVCVSADDSKAKGEVSDLMTARANVGVDLGKSLVYLTGGVASAEGTSSINDVTNGIDVSDTQTMLGVVVGAGVNYKVAENVSIGAEYLHVNFEDTNFDYSADLEMPANLAGAHASTDLNLLRISLNYSF